MQLGIHFANFILPVAGISGADPGSHGPRRRWGVGDDRS
ncbi:hypothetical protein BH18ACT8_BH18ACT8_11780 [soil metagenome]